MFAPQTIFDPENFIDLNGDGIDDRLQLSELGLVDRAWLWARAKLVKMPEAPADAKAPDQRHALGGAIAQVSAAPSSALRAPANPVNKDPDGYEYRSVAVRGWARAAFEALAFGARGRAPQEIPDLAAMAFALASESPPISKFPQYALAIGEAIANAAAAAKITVHQRVTMDGVRLASGRLARAAGHFGRQSGRWCASLQWPTAQHVKAGELVLAAERPLIGHGARRWFDGRVMDRGKQAGKPLAYDAAGLMRKWGLEGWELADPVVIPRLEYKPDAAGKLQMGERLEQVIDPYVLALMVFKGRGQADIDKGLRAVTDGRKRWGTK